MNDPGEIILFQAEDGQTRIDVRLVGETVWLSAGQIAELFQRDKSTISRHIQNVFEEGELKAGSVVALFATTAADGKTYQVEHYSLDVIISVGYRVKSHRGVQLLPAEAGGFPAGSRWLSGATPPDNRPPPPRTPAGVPAPSASPDALYLYVPSLSLGFLDPAPTPRSRCHVARRAPRLSWRLRPGPRWLSRGRWWRVGSCAFTRFAQSNPPAFGFHARTQKSLVRVDSGDASHPGFSLAGGLCGLFCERLGEGCRSHLHRRAGRAPSENWVSRGTDRFSRKTRRALRGTISRLGRVALASRRDAGNNVRNSVPVVSLRSTTGYRLSCLRHEAEAARALPVEAGGLPTLSQWFPAEAFGFLALSRWLSNASPPANRPPSPRTPTGVPAQPKNKTGKKTEGKK